MLSSHNASCRVSSYQVQQKLYFQFSLVLVMLTLNSDHLNKAAKGNILTVKHSGHLIVFWSCFVCLELLKSTIILENYQGIQGWKILVVLESSFPSEVMAPVEW